MPTSRGDSKSPLPPCNVSLPYFTNCSNKSFYTLSDCQLNCKGQCSLEGYYYQCKKSDKSNCSGPIIIAVVSVVIFSVILLIIICIIKKRMQRTRAPQQQLGDQRMKLVLPDGQEMMVVAIPQLN